MIFTRVDRRDAGSALHPRSRWWNSEGIATGATADGVDAERPRPERDVSGGLGSSARSALVLDVSGLGRTHVWAPALADAHTIR